MKSRNKSLQKNLEHIVEELKNAMKNVRLSFGWTRSRLAKEMEISEDMVASIETGRRNPSIITIKKLIKVIQTEYSKS